MSPETEDLEALLAEQAKFDEIALEYDDSIDCYRSLRDEAKRSLTTFDEYQKFYSVCLDQGPTGFVINDLNDNAVRSIKNMILGSSRAGRQFPVHSAAEIHQRINKYQDLGDDSVDNLVSYRAIVFTTLEHLFDSDREDAAIYKEIDDILAETPEGPSEITSVLARARFVIAVQLTDKNSPAIEKHFIELIDTLPDFNSEDDRPAEEIKEAAEQREYSDPEKVELAQSSLVRQGNEDELFTFLYLSARDVVERYRHQNREDPWRGELQLAERQLDCLLHTFNEDLSTERKHRARSYYKVLTGELRSGGRWRSQRDSRRLPEANFLAAGQAYVKAANAIYPHDKSRFIKYLSRSFRNIATASRHRGIGPNHGWMASKTIHERAIDVITNTLENIEGPEGLTETVVGTVALHNYRRHRAGAVVAFDQNAFKLASDKIDEAFDHLDAIPVYESTEILKSIRGLIEARELELDSDFESAYEHYEQNSHPTLDLENRIALVEIKRSLVEERVDTAREIAEEVFGVSSPVMTAVRIVIGENSKAPSIRPPVLENVLALDQKAKWEFTLSMYFASSADGENRTEWVEEFLLSL